VQSVTGATWSTFQALATIANASSLIERIDSLAWFRRGIPHLRLRPHCLSFHARSRFSCPIHPPALPVHPPMMLEVLRRRGVGLTSGHNLHQPPTLRLVVVVLVACARLACTRSPPQCHSWGASFKRKNSFTHSRNNHSSFVESRFRLPMHYRSVSLSAWQLRSWVVAQSSSIYHHHPVSVIRSAHAFRSRLSSWRRPCGNHLLRQSSHSCHGIHPRFSACLLASGSCRRAALCHSLQFHHIYPNSGPTLASLAPHFYS
jgi:hypothetical protein